MRWFFSALQAMAKRGHLQVPVTGVTKAGWKLEQLRTRGKDSVEKRVAVEQAFDVRMGAIHRKAGTQDQHENIWASAALKDSRKNSASSQTKWQRPRKDCSGRISMVMRRA